VSAISREYASHFSGESEKADVMKWKGETNKNGKRKIFSKNGNEKGTTKKRMMNWYEVAYFQVRTL